MDEVQAWCMNIEEMQNKAEVHSINTSKGYTAEVGIFSDNAKITIFEFLKTAELAYLGWGNSTQKANRLYNKHLSEEIKSQLISLSNDYKRMKNWLIENYGSPSRIVSDIIRDLLEKRKPSTDNRKQKFVFFSAITGAIQRLERLFRVSFVDSGELEACLLCRGTLSGLISLLPPAEHDFWVRDMSKSQLDFRNPEGLETFNCFKRVCVIKRNTNES